MNKDLQDKFYVGEWLVEPLLGRISQGSEKVTLRPKVMDLLVYLSQRNDTVVSHDELMETVWDGTIVTESSLYHCMNLLREALGDDKNHPQYITTISKRGYRLIASVVIVQNDKSDLQAIPNQLYHGATNSPPLKSTRTMFIGILLIVISIVVGVLFYGNSLLSPPSVDEKPSIAVLAFKDFSADGDQEYFADGMSDEIINRLVKTDSMRVTGSTSSFSFKGKGVTIPEVANKLGVDHILEGSIRKSGDTIRVTAQLINAASDEHLWSGTYDRNMSDILALQDEIATAVVEALQISLKIEIARPAHEINPEAYDLYLKGMHGYRNRSFHELAEGRKSLESALALDPDFKLARYGLAKTIYAQINTGSVPREPALTTVKAMAEIILKEEPATEESLIVLALVAWIARDRKKALKYMEKAKSLGANSAEFYRYYGRLLFLEGNRRDGMVNMRYSLLLNPLDGVVYLNLGKSLVVSGLRAEAKEIYKKGTENAPENPDNWIQLAWLHTVAGDIAAAVVFAEKSVSTSPGDPELIDVLVYFYTALEDFDMAHEWASKALALNPIAGRSNLAKAKIFLASGQLDKAAALALQTLDNPKSIHRLGSKGDLINLITSIYIMQEDFAKAESMLLKHAPKLSELETTPSFIDYGALDNFGVNPYFIVNMSVLSRLTNRPDKARNFSRHSSFFTEKYILENMLKRLRPLDYRNLAISNAIRGNDEMALGYLEQAIASGAYLGWHIDIQYNPAFIHLHKHPRFIKLIASIRAEMTRQRSLLKMREVSEANE